MDTAMTISVLLTLPIVLRVPIALSAALATTQQPCPRGQFFNSKLALCNFCPVLPGEPTEQELQHFQQQCRNHPVCCRAGVPIEAPSGGSATTSPSAGAEHPASCCSEDTPGATPPHGHHTMTSPTAVEPPGRSRPSTGAIVAIAAIAILVLLLTVVTVLLVRQLRSRRGPRRRSLARGGPTITNRPIERSNSGPYEQILAAQGERESG